ncbi:30S ribosomal protein S3ae [Methanoculleus sp. FWC-SCC1]|uniref:Small ribosomal subunit protein eS1 n=1 Tax=Methanoculleus frigidifontis TaxID=2584085 RepID=A0ABT8M9D5_9EURY|nr:30S ribosomal protein S3ae [Methanoculleus sp. FWC-SCC1]MDN7024546.1 30S ribosomal protein S3ae [Methanoculleus sp. FWC-SCC1]
MARKKQVGRRVEGWKAKKWYRVHVPESFGKTEIGDTITADPENLVGRVMTATLAEVVQDYSKSHIKMKFKINNVAGESAYTEFVGHEVTRDYLRSLVKRRTSRVDTTMPVITKDRKKLRLTVVCLTLSRAEQSQIHAIRLAIMQQIAARAAESDLETMVKDIMSGDLSRDLFKAVKTIYPVRRIEVTKSKIERIAAV